MNNLSYQTINDIVGALEGAKMEFYRRIVVPYEDQKREINGDVYGSKFLTTEQEKLIDSGVTNVADLILSEEQLTYLVENMS